LIDGSDRECSFFTVDAIWHGDLQMAAHAATQSKEQLRNETVGTKESRER
jgi:hypothetical protein